MSDIHLEISGRVQGVGFRWFVRERARRLGLAGWVRNLDDGNVEVVARGPDEMIAQLVSMVEQGPPGAHVDEVRRRSPPADTEYPLPFTVVR